MARATEMKSKLVVKDLDNPKKGATLDNDGDKFFMGTIYGICEGTNIRTLPTGETFEGLKGQFKGVPADEAKSVVVSGICYLDASVQNVIIGQLGDDAANVEFAFKVYSVKSTNAAGYQYSYEPLIQPTAEDPLSRLEAKVTAALPAPEPKKTKAA